VKSSLETLGRIHPQWASQSGRFTKGRALEVRRAFHTPRAVGRMSRRAYSRAGLGGENMLNGSLTPALNTRRLIFEVINSAPRADAQLVRAFEQDSQQPLARSDYFWRPWRCLVQGGVLVDSWLVEMPVEPHCCRWPELMTLMQRADSAALMDTDAESAEQSAERGGSLTLRQLELAWF